MKWINKFVEYLENPIFFIVSGILAAVMVSSACLIFLSIFSVTCK